jgi:hypothetical protein
MYSQGQRESRTMTSLLIRSPPLSPPPASSQRNLKQSRDFFSSRKKRAHPLATTLNQYRDPNSVYNHPPEMNKYKIDKKQSTAGIRW